MSELNFELLQENIRALLKKHDLTQNALAEIAGMTQANVSKALNRNESKQFTIDQVFRIAQHFGVSIDELVGNKSSETSKTSPRAMLALLTTLLCNANIRFTDITEEELIYDLFESDGILDCRRIKQKVEYQAFYFPDFMRPSDYAKNEQEYEDTDMEFCCTGNYSKYQKMNEVLKKLIPMIKLYRETEIPDEAFQMVLKGYLEQLPEK